MYCPRQDWPLGLAFLRTVKGHRGGKCPQVIMNLLTATARTQKAGTPVQLVFKSNIISHFKIIKDYNCAIPDCY